MSTNIDLIPAMNSAVLRELDDAVAAALGSETINHRNASEIESITRSTVHEPEAVLRDLLAFASSSEEALSALAGSYDEKEFWIRLFLKGADNYSLRLHVWLPSPEDKIAVETAHSHRRYLISYILNNSYTVYEFRGNADKTVELAGRRAVPSGTCYTIGPETIHAVSNQTPKHTVSLIVRGNAVTNEIQFFDNDTHSLVEYVSQRPIGNLGRSAEELAMDGKAYLRYRLGRLASECGLGEYAVN